MCAGAGLHLSGSNQSIPHPFKAPFAQSPPPHVHILVPMPHQDAWEGWIILLLNNPVSTAPGNHSTAHLHLSVPLKCQSLVTFGNVIPSGSWGNACGIS